MIATVKTILSEAHFREDIDSDPGAKIGIIKREKRERGILSQDELAFLFKDIPVVWDSLQAYCVFNTAAKTGLRCGEVLALTWGALDFQEEIMDIQPGLERCTNSRFAQVEQEAKNSNCRKRHRTATAFIRKRVSV